MREFVLNPERLIAASGKLGEVIVDPSLWPRMMDEICAAAGAIGGALLQTDIRTPDIPRTESVDLCFKHYFAGGWQTRDTRAERSVPLLAQGKVVVTDQDIVTPEEMSKLEFYNECAFPFGLPWFAGVGLWAESALWAMVIQRSRQQGPFEPHETRALSLLSPRLSEIATLSKAVGYAALRGIANALYLVAQPAIALDRLGFVLETNAAAAEIFDDEFFVHNRRIVVRDQHASNALDGLVDQLRSTEDTAPLPVVPIVSRRAAKQPLVIRILPVTGPARTPFLGARVLLLISDLRRRAQPPAAVLSQTFGLTPAEARLASIMATGISIERAADHLGLSQATVRNQLKAVFAKTATHRQSELIALLSRI